MNIRIIVICNALIIASCQSITEWKKPKNNMDDQEENPAVQGSRREAINQIGYYMVNGDVDGNAYFHSKPDKTTRRNAYLIKGEEVYIKNIENGFGYAEFANPQGKITKGWIDLFELNPLRRTVDKGIKSFGKINPFSFYLYSTSGKNDTIIVFPGDEFFATATVHSGTQSVKIVLNRINGGYLTSKTISFDILPNYLTFYNSKFIMRENDRHYFVDLITGERIENKNEFNKYYENMPLGLYNPVLDNNNVLSIYDKNIKLISRTQLLIDNQGQSWILNGTSDVYNGKILLSKLIKEAEVAYMNEYEKYVYNVGSGKLISQSPIREAVENSSSSLLRNAVTEPKEASVSYAGTLSVDGYSTNIVISNLKFDGTLWTAFINSRFVVMENQRDGKLIIISDDPMIGISIHPRRNDCIIYATDGSYLGTIYRQ